MGNENVIGTGNRETIDFLMKLIAGMENGSIVVNDTDISNDYQPRFTTRVLRIQYLEATR